MFGCQCSNWTPPWGCGFRDSVGLGRNNQGIAMRRGLNSLEHAVLWGNSPFLQFGSGRYGVSPVILHPSMTRDCTSAEEAAGHQSTRTILASWICLVLSSLKEQMNQCSELFQRASWAHMKQSFLSWFEFCGSVEHLFIRWIQFKLRNLLFAAQPYMFLQSKTAS